MTLRDDLIPIVDVLRDTVVDGVAGLRVHTVSIRMVTWDSGRVGLGTKTCYDHELEPVPKVMDPSPKMTFGPGGLIEEGDRIVSKVSAIYDKADLFDISPADGTEQFWLIDGEEYITIGEPQLGYLGWKVQVRRRRRKTTAASA